MAGLEPATREIPLEEISPSPTNPRQTLDEAKLGELVASICAHGVLQPILVRPHPERDGLYEIVFGHRRFEAAARAGLRTIPAMVRELDDRATLEAQVLENLQREDVPPVEEAEGLRRLHEDHGYTVEQLASRIGKTKSYVYSRLALCALPPSGREALARGELTLGAALVVARIPNDQLREEAIRELLNGGDFRGGEVEPATAAEARELVEERFLRRLDGAPFDTTADAVVPGVGPCSTCPRRTGNQVELFPDARSPDICSDPPCFREKADAAWKRRTAEARAQGRKVATPEETKKLFPYPHSAHVWDSAYVDLDYQNWESPKRRTWRQCLGKRAAEVAILARDPTGAIREVAKKDQAIRICRELGQEWAHQVRATRAEKTPEQKKADEKRRMALHARRLAIEQLVERAEIGDQPNASGLWHLLAQLAIHGAWKDTRTAAATRRGLEFKGDPKTPLLELVERMTLGQARGLVVELLGTPGVLSPHYGYGTGFQAPEFELALAHYGVDLKAIEAGVKAAAKATAKTRPPRGKAPKAARKTAKERRAAGARTKASASVVED